MSKHDEKCLDVMQEMWDACDGTAEDIRLTREIIDREWPDAPTQPCEGACHCDGEYPVAVKVEDPLPLLLSAPAEAPLPASAFHPVEVKVEAVEPPFIPQECDEELLEATLACEAIASMR